MIKATAIAVLMGSIDLKTAYPFELLSAFKGPHGTGTYSASYYHFSRNIANSRIVATFH